MNTFPRKTCIAIAVAASLLQTTAQNAPEASGETKKVILDSGEAVETQTSNKEVYGGGFGGTRVRGYSGAKSEKNRSDVTFSDDVLIQSGGMPDQLFRTHPGLFGNPANDASPLLIRTSKSDPKEDGLLEEDLVVMRRILEKAILPGSGERAQGRAMGIPLVALGGSRMPGSIYLQGYGALFLFETDLPLLPAPEKKQNEKSKERGSTWEETKQEIYGGEAQFRMSPKFQMGDESGEPYDAAKVEDLKNSILKALVNASNIRGLSNERVVIVVSNRSRHEPRDRFRAMAFANADAGRTSAAFDADPKHVYAAKARPANGAEKNEGKMTIAVKQSDIELFAKKSIDLEGFKKKAEITIY
ncbi:MAG: hypothetical protein JWM99_3710 [Verrucomicrobiales bacterium]|nr:hypothetical protein [Verrucomicrobiales bacterium]